MAHFAGGYRLYDAASVARLELIRSLRADRGPDVPAGASMWFARYRELLAVVKGLEPAAAHREEFVWVVAALEARVGS
ncbi:MULTISPECIES: hypothetical protein [Streptomyces]|uniref:hypothetical protein n=1 Tax=Streptomyces TaxID=1883 RepID=UPI001E4F6B0D|nr:MULTISPECIES: hypothetical protein [Streptomyces]